MQIQQEPGSQQTHSNILFLYWITPCYDAMAYSKNQTHGESGVFNSSCSLVYAQVCVQTFSSVTAMSDKQQGFGPGLTVAIYIVPCRPPPLQHCPAGLSDGNCITDATTRSIIASATGGPGSTGGSGNSGSGGSGEMLKEPLL